MSVMVSHFNFSTLRCSLKRGKITVKKKNKLKKHIYIYKQDLFPRNKMEKAIPNPKLFIFRKLLHETFRLEEAFVSSSMIKNIHTRIHTYTHIK